MRREVLVAAIVVVVATAVVGVFLLTASGPPQGRPDTEPPPTPGRPASLAAPGTSHPATPAPAAAGPAPMAFTHEGLAGEILQEAERVAGQGRAQVAVQPRGDGRWVCVLVHGDARYAELDQGLSLDDFPCLRDAGFAPPPTPITRTMSIYRSYAKRRMGYDPARGDRIVVLLCPHDDWPRLSLAWPAPTTAPKPTSSD